MVKHKDSTPRIRRVVVVAAILAAAIIVAFGLFYSGGDAVPYRTLDRPGGDGDVQVVEYFSYACPHCRSLDELVADWHESLPEGIVFKRVHVAYSPATRLLAKAHLALERHNALAANHERIFRAIHDRNRTFASTAAVADYVDGYGIDRKTFIRAVDSPRIAAQVAAGEREFVDLGLTGVPALVVDGKHIINMNLGRKSALAAASDLARELLAKRNAASAEAEG